MNICTAKQRYENCAPAFVHSQTASCPNSAVSGRALPRITVEVRVSGNFVASTSTPADNAGDDQVHTNVIIDPNDSSDQRN